MAVTCLHYVRHEYWWNFNLTFDSLLCNHQIAKFYSSPNFCTIQYFNCKTYTVHIMYHVYVHFDMHTLTHTHTHTHTHTQHSHTHTHTLTHTHTHSTPLVQYLVTLNASFKKTSQCPPVSVSTFLLSSQRTNNNTLPLAPRQVVTLYQGVGGTGEDVMVCINKPFYSILTALCTAIVTNELLCKINQYLLVHYTL